MRRILSAFAILILALPPSAHAQEKVSLTITPPFVEIAVVPGQFWASALKIVNTNPTDLTVYASPMDFRADGETGHGKFSPVLPGEQEEGASLSTWIDISSEPITIAPEQSGEIPFSIRVPENAPPGGHYAAILVGTKPFGSPDAKGPVVTVSSFVSSLFFVRVAGEVNEAGGIREFSTEERLYESPEVKFTLRFENAGNVHIQPQGEVVIYNMWGKERGKILVNQDTDLGNVLPGTVRRFEFDWKGEGSLFDIGQYTAVATLTFGKEMRQNVTRTIVFWIIPVKETAAVVFGTAVFIFLILRGLKAYVRRALQLAMVPGGPVPARPIARISTYTAPIREGVVDLRRASMNLPPPAPAPADARWFFHKYRFVITVALPLAILAVIWIAAYFAQVLRGARPFEIRTGENDRGAISVPREAGSRVEIREESAPVDN